MSRITWIVLGLLILGGLGYLVFTATVSQPKSDISFGMVQDEIKTGATLYDVRTAEEYNTGHFENAKSFPLQLIESGKLPEVAKESKIYVYCRSGNRSSQAKSLLEKAGYTNITDLGGLTEVQQLGGNLDTN